MSTFGTTAENNYDGLVIPSLEPAKYENVVLKSVVAERLQKQDGSVGKFALKFNFETEDGKLHQHTEYELTPGEDKFESKWKNQTKRIGHIMSKYVDKSLLSQNANSWEEYANWVVRTLGSVQYPQMKMDILITGNVYNNKATSGFTGYPPFIAKHGDQLVFDNNGNSANKAYYLHMEKQNNSTPDTEQGPYNTQEGVKADF